MNIYTHKWNEIKLKLMIAITKSLTKDKIDKYILALRSVHTRRHVAATRRCDKPLLVNRWGDKLLQQLTATSLSDKSLRVYKISDEGEC